MHGRDAPPDLERGDDATDLSARTREAVLAAITTDEAEDRPSSAPAMAIALASAIEGETPHTLSSAETTMLREWLRAHRGLLTQTAR